MQMGKEQSTRVSINVREIENKKEVESVIVEGSEKDREKHGVREREKYREREYVTDVEVLNDRGTEVERGRVIRKIFSTLELLKQ